MASTKLPARLLDTSAVPALTVSGNLTVDTNTLHVDSSNNRVGIGITNPSERMELGDGSSTNRIKIDSSSKAHYIGYDGSDDALQIAAQSFTKFQSGGSFLERMRLTDAGVLAIGKTSDDSTTPGIWLRKHPTSGHGQIMCAGSGSSAYEGLYVRDTSNGEMEFMASYHGTIYYRNTAGFSDERKKENIQDITLGLNAVKELRPVSFNWKNDKGNDQLGFIAQEVETTSLKQLVGTYKDEDVEDYRTLHKEGLIPVLVKAVQEQQTIIEDLKARIETLEG